MIGDKYPVFISELFLDRFDCYSVLLWAYQRSYHNLYPFLLANGRRWRTRFWVCRKACSPDRWTRILLSVVASHSGISGFYCTARWFLSRNHDWSLKSSATAATHRETVLHSAECVLNSSCILKAIQISPYLACLSESSLPRLDQALVNDRIGGSRGHAAWETLYSWVGLGSDEAWSSIARTWEILVSSFPRRVNAFSRGGPWR